jgi:hypothetical protein
MKNISLKLNALIKKKSLSMYLEIFKLENTYNLLLELMIALDVGYNGEMVNYILLILQILMV